MARQSQREDIFASHPSGCSIRLAQPLGAMFVMPVQRLHVLPKTLEAAVALSHARVVSLAQMFAYCEMRDK